MDFQLIQQRIREAESPNLETRTQAIEYLNVSSHVERWGDLLQLMFTYFTTQVQPAETQLIFWALQVLEASVDLITREPQVLREFLVAIVGHLQTSDNQVYLKIPPFIRNKFAMFLAQLFFRQPVLLSEYFFLLSYDLFLRVCIAFDECVNAKTTDEKEMLKKILNQIFARFIEYICSHSSSDAQSVANVIGTCRIIGCFIEWCDINLVTSNMQTFKNLFTHCVYSIAVLDMFCQVFHKGMLPENKMALIDQFELDFFFSALGNNANNSSCNNFDLFGAMARLINELGKQLFDIVSDSSLTDQMHQQATILISSKILPFYHLMFTIKCNDVVHDDDNDDDQSDDDESDLDDVSVELVEFSEALVLIAARNSDKEFAAKLLDLHLTKLSENFHLLREYYPLFDLIASNFPDVIETRSSQQNLFLMTHLGLIKGRNYFLKSQKEFSQSGLKALEMLGQVSQKSRFGRVEVEFVDQFNFLFNIPAQGIPELYLQIMNRIVLDLEELKRKGSLFYRHLSCFNRMIKTKAVELVQNNQQLIMGLWTILQNIAFIQKNTLLDARKVEIINDGFVSLGVLIRDETVLLSLFGEFQKLFTDSEIMTSERVYYAIGHVIKGLLSGVAPVTLGTQNSLLFFNQFFSDILNNFSQLLLSSYSNSSSNSSSIQATHPFTDAVVFALIKLSQIRASTDLQLFQLLYPVYANELFAHTQYILHKFRRLDPNVFTFLLTSATINANNDTLSLRHCLGRHLLLFNFLNAIPAELLICTREIDQLSIYLLDSIMQDLNVRRLQQTTNSFFDQESTRMSDVDVNLLLKGIFSYYRRNHQSSSSQIQINICLKGVQVVAECTQTDASFISCCNELFTLMQLNRDGLMKQQQLSGDLLTIANEQDQSKGRKALRQYFKQKQLKI